MTHQAPRVRNYLHPLGHHAVRHQRKLRPGRWPSEMLWMLPSPLPCPGRTRYRRKKNEKGIPLPEVIPSRVHLPRHWKVVALVTSPWLRRVPCNATLTVIIEEEREESMETDTPLDSAAPTLKEKAILEDLKAKVDEDRCSQASEESTDQNPAP